MSGSVALQDSILPEIIMVTLNVRETRCDAMCRVSTKWGESPRAHDKADSSGISCDQFFNKE